MYGIDLSVQFENLMPALGLGFILSLLYDFIRFLRLCISEGKIFMFVTDMLFVVFCTLSSFLLYIAVNSGHIRLYLILAEVVAAVIYRLTFGTLVFAFLKKIASVFKQFVKLIFSPFVFVGRKIRTLSRKISSKAHNKLKKIKINLEKPLKDGAEL